MEQNDDLRQAYYYIKNIYEEENISIQYLDKITVCDKWNCVFTKSGNVGMAFNFTGEHAVHNDVFEINEFIKLKSYVNKNLFDFVEGLLSLKGLQMRSVSLATLNALSQSISTPKHFRKREISFLDPQDFSFIKPSDIVTLIGYGGVIDRIYGKCKEFHVLDMRPTHLLRSLSIGENIEYGPTGINFHPANENKEILSKSDVVIMSGCTIVNGTFKELIKYSTKARIIGMFGPSAQITPRFLFENGLNYVVTSKVINTKGLYSSIMNPFCSKDSLHSNMESYAVNLS